jgi:hypothetical protein
MNEFDNLELSTETLRELTPEELTVVAGGALNPTGPQPTPPVYVITHNGVCESLLTPCLPATEACAR